MLVLTRAKDERIIIGDNIIITVNRINHNSVSLGITAPDDVSVHREEVAKRLGWAEPGSPPASPPGAD